MKRKPTPKGLRAGQTLYFASMNPLKGMWVYELNSVRVLSDRSEMPPENVRADSFPRGYIREVMERDPAGGPPMSYSRRAVETWIKRNSRVSP